MLKLKTLEEQTKLCIYFLTKVTRLFFNILHGIVSVKSGKATARDQQL